MRPRSLEFLRAVYNLCMDMNRGAVAIAAAIITCVAGCVTKPIYVPPAQGEPQAIIHGQNEGGGLLPFCTHAHLFRLDDQNVPFNYRVTIQINPGPHVASIRGMYGVLPIPSIFGFVCLFSCDATLQFTAEQSHAYQLALIKESAPYHIDLIDSETNKPVASAPCLGSFHKGKQPPTPEPDTGTGFMGTPH